MKRRVKHRDVETIITLYEETDMTGREISDLLKIPTREVVAILKRPEYHLQKSQLEDIKKKHPETKERVQRLLRLVRRPKTKEQRKLLFRYEDEDVAIVSP